MNDVIQIECKSFAIGVRVTLFGLNNMGFNRKVGFIESPLEPPVRQDVTLHSPPLKWSQKI